MELPEHRAGGDGGERNGLHLHGAVARVDDDAVEQGNAVPDPHLGNGGAVEGEDELGGAGIGTIETLGLCGGQEDDEESGQGSPGKTRTRDCERQKILPKKDEKVKRKSLTRIQTPTRKILITMNN